MNKTFRFELSEEDVGLVFAAIGKLPYEAVFQLVGKLQKQAQEQSQIVAPGAEPFSNK